MKSLIADEFVPKRATPDSAGYDFFLPEDVVIRKGEWTVIDTGVVFEDTDLVTFDDAYFKDWFMLVLPRSGLGFKHGFRLANGSGVIDNKYRDTIKAKVTIDIGDKLELKKGDRFMQGIIIPFGKMRGETIPTEERKGGFGSTGA